MQAAQSALDAAGLRGLAQERRQLLSRAVKAARELAVAQGRPISAAVAAEVEQTLRAAATDAGAAAAVQSGCLLRALSADGVDVVDLAGAVAVPGSLPGPGEPSPRAAPGAADGAVTRRRTRRGTAPSPGCPVRVQVTPAPSAVERARAGLQDAEESAAAADDEARRAAAELAEADSRYQPGWPTRRTNSGGVWIWPKPNSRRHGSVTSWQRPWLQQTARAADRERRKEDLARERVLRLGNTPEA